MMKKHYLFFVMQPYSFSILRPLQKAILEQGDDVAWFLTGNDVTASSLTPQEKRLTTVEQVKEYNPRAVFVPGNIVPDFFPGVKVQVFHGLEYKKKGHFAIRGFFDLYCTFGPLTTEPFRQLAKKHGYFKVIETGWPKLDPYFDYAQVNNTKPIILYAPTFSPSLSSIPFLHQQLVELAAKNKYHLIVKFHPKTQADWVNLYKNSETDNFQISDAENLVPLIQQSNIVISDTSSAVDESLLLGKPVITFKNSAPQAALLNFERPELLNNLVEEAFNITKEHRDTIDSYIKQIHPFVDGKSAQRVIDATEELIAQGVKQKPLNLVRKYKIRKKLNYMKFN